MVPPTGIHTLVALFDRATGARLEGAERFVAWLPTLFPGALVECDLALQPRTAILVLVMRFEPARFGADDRRRLDFWAARAGVRATALDALTATQQAAFRANVDRCELKLKSIGPEQLAREAGRLFTDAGAPADRRRPAPPPVLAMDVGGPGWEGVRFPAGEQSLFIPGVLAPAAGDVLTLALRFPGVDRPLECEARVADVRGAERVRPGAPAGFTLALTSPPASFLEALERQFGTASPRDPDLRAHPRYAVKAPVVVTPEPAGAPGAGDATGTACIEYADEQELAQDYVDNLSQGGAFVRTANPAAVGARITLSMKLPRGEELTTQAVVAVVNDRGMGVRFELDPAGQERLAAAIAHLSARPRRALLVDDDVLVRNVLQDALQQRGFEVLTAADGAAGLHLLSEELLALDLLVTDVRMPNMDGHALIRTIRNAGGESELAIVAVTGALDPAVEKRLERDGADAVLDKALGPELIAQAADAALERKRHARRR